ncbi:hypothetical protein CW670_11000 [Macrococcoides caseolyticum]|uniref:hypothetical protein n=1 Tax=Macrococcoides caseolyticum TaxID=69966 RepID=UPI000C31C9C6|nr:hypothetical protein [Macrococcus caseolyticus]PKE73658.1 hypothetical protein CW670_11000 [Macrococcus caseolyticus]
MNKRLKLYVVTGLSILVLGLVAIMLFFNPFDSRNDVNDSTIKSDSNSVVKDNKQYSNNQIEKANQRDSMFLELEKAMNKYVTGIYAPTTQKEYDEALGMRSTNDIKSFEKSAKKLIDDDTREVTDTNFDFQLVDNKTVSGNYEFDLSYTENGFKKTETRTGVFVLKTNSKGYFYIERFK